MIESRLQASGRATIPPAVREALGLKPGDMIRYEIDGDQVLISRSEEPDDLFTDDELRPIIAQALADAELDGRTYSLEEVFAELHERIETLSGRKDVA